MTRSNRHKAVFVALFVFMLFVMSMGVVWAAQVKVGVGMAKPTLLADQKQTTHLKVSLTGFEWAARADRTPVNVAIVIDKSGSMSGAKIQKAKEAAMMVVDRLSGRDIVSVVAYDSSVRVLVPATKVAEKAALREAINTLRAGGSTALFAGVSKGAAEVRKFLNRNRVNRVILLSDGLANVGPSCPKQLGDLGASLVKNGIAVTTIGLGLNYNEDLMSQLAQRSDGNHYFAENATDLARIFKGELGDVLSVCAQEVTVQIKCRAGVRPVRVLGREADITGQTVITVLNQLYSGQEKYVMLEVEVEASKGGTTRPVADVKVSYANMATKTAETLTRDVAVRFDKSKEVVAKAIDKKVAAAAVELIATDVNKQAVVLRDAGKIEAARTMLQKNAAFLNDNAAKLKSKRLIIYGHANILQADNLDAENWRRNRKDMRSWQRYNEAQQKTR